MLWPGNIAYIDIFVSKRDFLQFIIASLSGITVKFCLPCMKVVLACGLLLLALPLTFDYAGTHAVHVGKKTAL